MGGYPTQTVLRRSSEEVRWYLLTPPDVVKVAENLSRRLRRELEHEALTVIGGEGDAEGQLGRIGVRASQKVSRPWFALGLAVRCRVEAAAKVRVHWTGTSERAASSGAAQTAR